MKEGKSNPKLYTEERKAIILFIWLFYLVYFSFEIITNFSAPRIYKDKASLITGLNGLGLWLYVLVIGILFIGVHFIKRGNPFIVKYVFVYSYFIIDSINVIMSYWGTNQSYSTGNIVEILFILFSPIFVNKRYFLVVSIVLIGKEIVLGLILHDISVFLPTVIYIILSLIAYVILIRFNSYINSLTVVHEELHHKEKLAVIGQMAAGIGHEIRNPLSSLRGFTQLQQERYPNTNDYYPIMIQEIDRINSIVNDLMYIGKPKKIKFEKASIEEIIAYTLSITQQQAERQGVTIETVMAGPLQPLECDENQLKQVFINLIKNAIESMPDGGLIQIWVKVMNKLKKLSISIQDEGIGIDDENILSLGEPFFTTKRDGTGLGLMVTNQIIKDHLGEINIQSIKNKGTKIEVILPIVNKMD